MPDPFMRGFPTAEGPACPFPAPLDSDMTIAGFAFPFVPGLSGQERCSPLWQVQDQLQQDQGERGTFCETRENRLKKIAVRRSIDGKAAA